MLKGPRVGLWGQYSFLEVVSDKYGGVARSQGNAGAVKGRIRIPNPGPGALQTFY